MDVGDAFVEDGLVIAIAIVQGHDLIAAHDVNQTIDDFEAERLMEARRKSFPAQRGEIVLQDVANPDVAVNGADGDAARRDEVHAAGEEERFPRVLVGQSESVDSVGLAGAQFAARDDTLGPLRASRFRFGDQRFDHAAAVR